MALTAGTTFEVRTGGSDTVNGGGYNTARDPANGIDRSQQDANHVAIDGAAITATVQATTTDVLIAGYTVIAGDVGNLVTFSGGTLTAGTYEIVSLPGGNIWRLDRSAGTVGQTGTGGMGGAFASPGKCSAVIFGLASPFVWVRSGTYLFTSALTTVAGGCVATSSGRWEGYQTTRGDRGTRPIFRASGITNATLLLLGNNEAWAINFEVDGASLSTIRGISFSGRVAAYSCIVRNCTNSGFFSTPSGLSYLSFCYATGCSTTGAAFTFGGGITAHVYCCIAEGNTVAGFTSGIAISDCLSINNTGATTDGFVADGAGASFFNCTAYGSGRDGFGNSGNHSSVRWTNCISESNGRHGFNGTAGIRIMAINCGTFGNVGNAMNPVIEHQFNNVTGAASFFIDAAGGDFTLNTVAGAGALLRGLAYSSPFVGSTQETFRDVGAVQHEDGGGGGGGGAHTGLPELGGTFG